MRIALYHHLPSGGALGHLCEVASGLKQAGHTLSLFCPATAELEFGNLDQIVDEKVVFQRHPWKAFFPFLNPLLYRTYLSQQLTEEKYYVKHIMASNPEGIYMGQCRLWTEPPLLRYLPKDLPKIIYCAEPKRSFYEQRFIDKRKQWPFWKKLWRLPTIEWMKAEMRENISNADLVLCNSLYSKDYISRVYPGIEPEFTAIGVDCDKFKPQEIPEPKRQLLSVGALDPSKNHDMAILVAAELPKELGFKVIIITDRAYGDTADHLRNLAEQKEVELEIKERVSQEVLIQNYAESFATIYCPHLEPFGRVSIESQACGTPVLGKNEGGLKETIVSGISGENFDKNPKQYSDKIIEWLQNPDLHKKYQKGARENVLENWNQEKTIKYHVSKIENFFKNKS